MNIEEKIIIELKPSDVKEIIKEYFKDRFDISNIEFKISEKCIGVGMNERYIDYLECIKIEAKNKK